ncbi:MAG TPA: hypothetical protein VN370_13405 [Desulfitobacteriaceae bacterium]|nr:hypothetical protein [Desulfitobacteriaceae bacterium]
MTPEARARRRSRRHDGRKQRRRAIELAATVKNEAISRSCLGIRDDTIWGLCHVLKEMNHNAKT